jgi:hypothetical protein
MRSFVEKTRQAQLGLMRGTEKRICRPRKHFTCSDESGPSPHVGQAGGGLARKRGPARKYLGYQKPLFNFCLRV